VTDVHLIAPGRMSLVEGWIDRFNVAMTAGDGARLAGLFSDDSYWRDLLALTGDIRTFAGRTLIAERLPGHLLDAAVTPFVLEEQHQPRVDRLEPFGDLIGAFFQFDTSSGHCRGFVRLTVDPDTGTTTAFTLLTSLEALHGADASPPSPSTSAEPDVLIVGAGQAGLGLAARLMQLGISVRLIERNQCVGDNWRNRYSSLKLHNQLVSCHLPGRRFPEHWPTYLPKDLVASFFAEYAQELGLEVWTGSEVIRADHTVAGWEVDVRDEDGVRTVRPRFVVMATGITGGVPKQPVVDGAELFKGTLTHSSGYRGTEDVGGKHVVVVGAGTSGHDIAHDVHRRGAASVTMVQRSSVTVVSLKSAEVQYATYNDVGPDLSLEDVDFISSSIPNVLARRLWMPITKALAEQDKDLLDGLHRAGFLTDQGEDGSGFIVKSMMTYGGFYIDVGASEMIIDGQIKVRSAVGVDHLTEREVVLTDGTTLAADMLVLATGFEPMHADIRRIFGPEVADRVGPIWGLSERDGELRGVWRVSEQPNFLVMGGGLAHCRIYSRYVALQIQSGLRLQRSPGGRETGNR
jgi:cation diffusion facilitator CzcD-associated flavoprotein CzcO